MMNNISSKKLGDDLWLIENNSNYLCYSPLRGKVFSITEKGNKIIHDYYESSAKVNGRINQFFKDKIDTVPFNKPHVNLCPEYNPVSIMFSLTDKCNMNCIYCYANSQNKKPKFIKRDVIKTASDYIITNAKANKCSQLKVLFAGSGESLIAWPLLKYATEYCSKNWEYIANFSLVTNGTLIDSYRADWFKKYNFKFTISLDGHKDIQNVNRPMRDNSNSYDNCIRGIELLKSRDLVFGIRATITKQNVNRIEDLIMLARDFNCEIKIEPMTKIGRSKINNVDSVPPELLLKNFYEAKKKAHAVGVKLSSTYMRGLECRASFCSADGKLFLIQPEGRITCCSRVTGKNDDLYDYFNIGQVVNDKVEINYRKYEQLKHLNVTNYKQCEECFVKWHCCGGCPNTRLLSGGVMTDDYCKLIKNFIWIELTEQLVNRIDSD